MKRLASTIAYLAAFALSTQGALSAAYVEVKVQNLEPYVPLTHKNSYKAIKAEEIPADIAYWIADIKLNEDGAKIVELGDGNFAGYKVLDNMYFKGKVWSQVWDTLVSFGRPVWYVGSYESAPDVVAWEHFNKVSGNYAPTLAELDERLKKMKSEQRTEAQDAKKIVKTLDEYAGVIILKRYNPLLKTYLNFRKNHPEYLIINETSSDYVGDKFLTDSLFSSASMKKFRPNALTFNKKYTKAIAARIHSKMPKTEWFVIKPINSGRGNGIIMTHASELDDNLRKILIENKCSEPVDDMFSFKPDNPMSFEYWQHDRNSRFLVEEYVESKPIFVDEKPYDATMRVIFVLRYEDETIKVDFVDAYWKKPIKALTDEGTFKEKHISKHAPNAEESRGLAVNEEDMAKAQKSMAELLPQLYWNLLCDVHAFQPK